MESILVLKFYADKPNYYRNRLFAFNVEDEEKALALLHFFASRGNFIRAAFINEFALVSGAKLLRNSSQLDKSFLMAVINGI